MKHAPHFFSHHYNFFGNSFLEAQEIPVLQEERYDFNKMLAVPEYKTPVEEKNCSCDENILGFYQSEWEDIAKYHKRANLSKFCCHRVFSLRIIYTPDLVQIPYQYYKYIEFYKINKSDSFCTLHVLEEQVQIENCDPWIQKILNHKIFSFERNSFTNISINEHGSFFTVELYEGHWHWWLVNLREKEVKSLYNIIRDLQRTHPPKPRSWPNP